MRAYHGGVIQRQRLDRGLAFRCQSRSAQKQPRYQEMTAEPQIHDATADQGITEIKADVR